MPTTARTCDWHSTTSAAPLPSWQRWLLRRRIPLSLTLFTALVVVDMFVLGVRPRSLWNWHDAGTVAGELLVVIGLAIRSWAAGTLVKTTSLIVAGPYALVRNPLYVGSFLMMFGFCLLVHDWQSIWFIVGPVAALYWLQVRQEEARLAACFADQWPAYAATTPRFVPRRWTSQALRGWSVNNWVRNREYQAVWATAVALAGLAAWRLLS